MPSIVRNAPDTGRLLLWWRSGFPRSRRLEPSGEWRQLSFFHLTEFYADFGRYIRGDRCPAGFRRRATGSPVSSSSDKAARFVATPRATCTTSRGRVVRSFRRRPPDTRRGSTFVALLPTGYDAVAERRARHGVVWSSILRKKYGRYLYDVLTNRAPREQPRSGGMEYPSCINDRRRFGTHRSLFATIRSGHDSRVSDTNTFTGSFAYDEQNLAPARRRVNSFAEAERNGGRLRPGSLSEFMGLSVGYRRDPPRHIGGSRSNKRTPFAQPAQAFAKAVGKLRALVLRPHRHHHRARSPASTDTNVLLRALGRYTEALPLRATQNARTVSSPRSAEVLVRPRRISKPRFFDKGWVDYATASHRRTREEAPSRGVRPRRKTRDGHARTLGGFDLGRVGPGERHGNLRFPVEHELWAPTACAARNVGRRRRLHPRCLPRRERTGGG